MIKKGPIGSRKRDPFGGLSQYSCFTLVCFGFRVWQFGVRGGFGNGEC